MNSNHCRLSWLVRKGIVNMPEVKMLYDDLPEINVDLERLKGMLLGIAIGDSLGNTSESLTPAKRRRIYGWIDGYLPNKNAGNERVGLPSDDTQLSFDTLKVILRNGYLDLEDLAFTFAGHEIFGIGSTVKDFLRNYKEFGLPWYRAGVRSAGNGALMRISPLITLYMKNRNREEFWADVILDTMLTHNDELAISSSLAFVKLLVYLFNGEDRKLDLRDILEPFSAITLNKEYRTYSHTEVYPYEYIEDVISSSLKADLKVQEFSERFGSSGYLLETFPAVLYIILKHREDPVEAILEAVNNTYDNDTIASIVGGAMGALYGTKAFKSEWISNLKGRIRENDDGTVFKLIESTEKFLLEKEQ